MEKIAFLASPMIFNSLKVNDELVSGPLIFSKNTHEPSIIFAPRLKAAIDGKTEPV